MSASYPTAVKTFTTKNTGDVIQASHIGDLQDEVNAIESGILNGTAPLNSSNSTHANLSVTGGSTVFGLVAYAGYITPTLSTGQNNNFNPTGLSSAFALRLSGNSSGSTLTGLHATSTNGELKLLINAGVTTIGVAHSNGGSSADARLILRSGSDTTMATNQTMLLWYDPASGFWRQIS